MAQGKRISSDIDPGALASIRALGAAARAARTRAGEGQATAAARLGVHVQTVARIEAGEPGVAIGHVLGMLALYGLVAAVAGADAADGTLSANDVNDANDANGASGSPGPTSGP